MGIKRPGGGRPSRRAAGLDRAGRATYNRLMMLRRGFVRGRPLLKGGFRIRFRPEKTPSPRGRLSPAGVLALGLTALVLALALGGACSNAAPPPPPPPEQSNGAVPPPAAPPSDPAAPPPAADLIPFVQLAMGRYGGQCGLGAEGRAVCQGRAPLRAVGALAAVQFRQVTVGQDFACGLGRDDAIACWGDALHAKTAPPPGQFTQVAAGKQHICALDSAGAAHCWGWNADGRATPPPGLVFTAIAAGGSHSCGLTAAGALHCWGKNDRGQANNHGGPFQSLALGVWNTCALRRDGTAWCQGDNAAGQSNPPPGAFTQIAAGSDYACGRRDSGRLECWGGGFGADLGEPAGAFTAVSSGWDTFCALDDGGYPLCWRYLPGSRHIAAEPIAAVSAGGATTPLQWPVELLPWPGGGLAVVEREGRIILCGPGDCAGAGKRPLLDLTDQVDFTAPESGMLSAALDPDFDRYPFLYVYYIRGPEPRQGRLSRFPIAAGRIDRAGELVLLEVALPHDERFGGAVRFGPEGMLYLGIGDNWFPEEAQSLESRRGKIIRIDGRGATEEQPYGIPADNPFPDTAGARPEIWAYGLRNPWRMSFDAAGRLWVGDVGATASEEVSIVTAGANLGWPLFEGQRCYGGETQCAALTGATPPVATYARDEGCAVIWGGQYQGAALPPLAGAYLFGDYCSGRIWALSPEGENGWRRRLAATIGSPLLAFGTDAAGEMYALSVNRPLLKLTPAFGAEPAAETAAGEP